MSLHLEATLQLKSIQCNHGDQFMIFVTPIDRRSHNIIPSTQPP